MKIFVWIQKNTHVIFFIWLSYYYSAKDPPQQRIFSAFFYLSSEEGTMNFFTKWFIKIFETRYLIVYRGSPGQLGSTGVHLVFMGSAGLHGFTSSSGDCLVYRGSLGLKGITWSLGVQLVYASNYRLRESGFREDCKLDGSAPLLRSGVEKGSKGQFFLTVWIPRGPQGAR